MKRLGLLVAAAVLGLGGIASAQNNVVKPDFLVMVDTSGSMLIGEGNGDPPVANSCGFMPRNRIQAARCGLNRLLNGVGDARFGLGRFHDACDGSGATGNCTTGCCYSDGFYCRFDAAASPAQGQILIGVGDDNNSALVRWVDNSGTGCSPGCTDPELLVANFTWTPIAGTLQRAREYYRNAMAGSGFTSPIETDRTATPRLDSCRPYRTIMLTDGDETCPDSATVPHPAPRAAACALRRTCLNGSQTIAPACDANGNVTNTPDCTGGTNTGLYDVRTYVIGFGIAAGNTEIEAIATAGGTDAPGAGRGFYATDEQSLSLAFSSIIQSSLLIEVCNNADDNCNSLVDEGFTKYCDEDGRLGTVVASESLCTPVPDDCDNNDDNCEAGTSDEPKNACGTCGAVPTEICDNLDNDCDGFIDEGGVCGTCIISPEICDGRDNDCDGRIDELVTRSCGSAIAPCTIGMQACVEQTVPQMMGTWGACSGTVGTPEMCDGVDNDCDGVVDGIVRACGTNTGECVAGTEECIAGSFMNCTAVGPQTEVCNGLDDNCNNMTDEGDPGGGGSCTAPAICGNGTLHCVMGSLMCQGSATAMPEVCNGVDDDCNNMIDDGIADRGPCGMPLGGACQAGVDRCVNGSFQCVGYVGPVPEVCNCIDDDCAGGVDNPPPGGSLCPVGSECTDCQCALPCGPGEFPCPAGKRCRSGFCVADPCAGVTCPNDADGTKKVCSMGTCIPICNQVSCGAPLVCRKTDGLCVPDNCHYFPDRCTTGQLCRGGQCITDACATVSCTDPQFCREGSCVSSCAGVSCAGNERCENGTCVATGCRDACGPGRICDVASGNCVNDRCLGVRCELGQDCDPDTGTCITDPCIGVTCPGAQICKLGDCFNQQQIDPDGGMTSNRPTKILVTGDGGCACETGSRGTTGTGARGGLLLGMAALLGLVVVRRRRRR